MNATYDYAIIGGGPGGSTVATLLKKYAPTSRVIVLERETFPRDHIGESQLPAISEVLDEMGVWEKVEAANFPIKIGATYRWGTTSDLWDFDFLPARNFQDEKRPARYEGQRTETAFQVDRSIYDKILLDHAAEMGVEVREGTKVAAVETTGDQVDGLRLANGEQIKARWYIDASGNAATLRRALDVPIDVPTSLQNIAIWDYWRNAEWAETIGNGGTRIQIMSLGYGWIWFIPLGGDRTSIGLVVPAEYYRTRGIRPDALYREALAQEPRLSRLMTNAVAEDKLATTKDWSYVSSRWSGSNWLLVGEAGGFADPILSAGMTLTHTSAREAAYTMLAIDASQHDPEWLRERYSRHQSMRVRQHMRFAEYWYASNEHFSDLKGYCAEIARDAGVVMDPESAFRWIGTGGFAYDNYGVASVGGFSVEAIKQLLQRFSDSAAHWQIGRNNQFRMHVTGAKRGKYAVFVDGEIHLEDALVRDGSELPLTGLFGLVISVLHQHSDATAIAKAFAAHFEDSPWLEDLNASVRHAFYTLETMITNGWVTATLDPNRPVLRFQTPDDSACLHRHLDLVAVPAVN